MTDSFIQGMMNGPPKLFPLLALIIFVLTVPFLGRMCGRFVTAPRQGIQEGTGERNTCRAAFHTQFQAELRRIFEHYGMRGFEGV